MLALLLTACQKKKTISGKAFIERDVLVDLLVDMHLADAATNDRKFNRKFDVDSIDILSPILEKYHVTRQMFDTTMYEYTRNPELLDLVYNDVLIKLNVMMDELTKEEDTSTQEE
jgi:hypothetical protein